MSDQLGVPRLVHLLSESFLSKTSCEAHGKQVRVRSLSRLAHTTLLGLNEVKSEAAAYRLSSSGVTWGAMHQAAITDIDDAERERLNESKLQKVAQIWYTDHTNLAQEYVCKPNIEMCRSSILETENMLSSSSKAFTGQLHKPH